MVEVQVSSLLLLCFTGHWESALNPLSPLGLLVFLWKEYSKKITTIFINTCIYNCKTMLGLVRAKQQKLIVIINYIMIAIGES